MFSSKFSSYKYNLLSLLNYLVRNFFFARKRRKITFKDVRYVGLNIVSKSLKCFIEYLFALEGNFLILQPGSVFCVLKNQCIDLLELFYQLPKEMCMVLVICRKLRKKNSIFRFSTPLLLIKFLNICNEFFWN